MTNYLMSGEGCETLMACFAILAVLAFLATGHGDKLRASKISRPRL